MSNCTQDAVLWRRLDVPGHDACRLIEDQHGWRLEGAAVFLHDGAPACLWYEASSGSDWLSREGRVRGFIGSLAVDVTITRAQSTKWTLNGTPIPGLDDCEHLDFGFTPATNLPHLRWLALNSLTSAQVPVAWLRPPFLTLERLEQRYTRLSERRYHYEAPSEEFATELSVGPNGFVMEYPGLWSVASF